MPASQRVCSLPKSTTVTTKEMGVNVPSGIDVNSGVTLVFSSGKRLMTNRRRKDRQKSSSIMGTTTAAPHNRTAASSAPALAPACHGLYPAPCPRVGQDQHIR